nr:immunoglobulin light chain junction region [Macaca mulatta]MPN91736.1 immunoglobulin light chain junction region [Macaca mulatta]MPN93479.1 immunoglobulin light chain junction region [Macaca mulatta]MPN93809.1 immunoglobulin light chain junction region [Macaca mulatta]MPN93825.1 immunoglobulin light chain junction region [Macaca mulatta]
CQHHSGWPQLTF